MFKFITALIALITAINSYSVTPVKDAPTKEEQHALFLEFLENDFLTYSWSEGIFGAFDSQDLSKRYYAFYDIDGNGIDEMIVGESGVEKDKKVSACYIFIIENNEVKPVKSFMGYFDQFDRCGPIFHKTGVIYDPCYDIMGIDGPCSYYRIENGELKKWCTFGIPGWGDMSFRSSFEKWYLIIYSDDGEGINYIIPGFIALIVMSYLNRGETVEPDWQSVSKVAQP